MMKLLALILSASLVLAGCSEDPVSTAQPPARIPPVTTPGNDGIWDVGAPDQEGLDADLLAELAQNLDDGDFGPVSSLLIVRNDKLVYEQYRRGMKRATKHPLYSVTKSVMALQFGMSVEQGEIADLNQSVVSYFPKYDSTLAATDPRRRISLRHLLQMRSGIDWDEWSMPYENSENPETKLFQSPNWVEFVLDRPVIHEPGTVFTYNSGLSIVLGEVIHRVTGQLTAHVVRDRLFSKIGIRDYAWLGSGTGITNTGGGLYLRPRDMARLGLLTLHSGVFEGEQLIPEKWFGESEQLYTGFSGGDGYGYQWWMLLVGGPSAAPDLLPYANGYGGQFIVISRRDNLVIVLTGEEYASRSPTRVNPVVPLRRILNEYVLASVE